MANGKQLKVDLVFGTNANETKAQVQSLQQSLKEVIKLPAQASSLFDDSSLRKASEAALELENHLSKAINLNTGKLDLSRFAASLKTSNKTLTDYTNQLLRAGTVGQQAFLQLAKSIAAADAPLTRINAKTAELMTTLKNTAKWQLSSSVLHGFMGAISSAYGYAQDLNKSLNEIRIVTGQNTDEMAEFAKVANKAAKELSTTTNEYAKASLIYYQQGLSDKEVAARTAVTVKMANAAGESAQEVSNHLTSVWNNFYDGSKSLEYYADVMTALGAATASSTKEISEGLNKFAAIGDTVGLSYEYAASALATVTATTRESAEVVGTAFKTLFARIQDLELGNTLDDGTTLGSYSRALATVGIDIKTTTGELKDMDTILSEMGTKWSTLSKDTQVALAQTVAGTRQYAQLIALMDNWSYFESNLNIAQTSSGTLEEQAKIYADSWEAAQDRVTAAAEKIYKSLINDEFFIDLLNGLEKVLESVSGLVDGLGGLKGMVGIVGSTFLSIFASKVPDALENLKENFKVMTGQGAKMTAEIQAELNHNLKMAKADPTVSADYKIQLDSLSTVNAMKQKLVLETRNLTDSERQAYENRIKAVESLYEEIRALERKKEAAEKAARASQMESAASGRSGTTQLVQDFYNAQLDKDKHEKRIEALSTEKTSILSKGDTNLTQNDKARLATINSSLQAENFALEDAKDKAQQLDEIMSQVAKAYGLTSEEVNSLVLNNGKIDPELAKKMGEAVADTTKQFQDLATKNAILDDMSISLNSQTTEWKNQTQEIYRYAQTQGASSQAMKVVEADVNALQERMKAYIKSLAELAQSQGVEIHAEELKDIESIINNMNFENMDEGITEFENFAQKVDKQLNKALQDTDVKLDEIRQTLIDMQVSPDVIDNMEETAGEIAKTNTQLLNAKANAENFGSTAPKSTFKVSQAFTEFGATVMSVSTLISTIENSIKVFGDESATPFEKMGAAVAILTAALSTYNTVQSLATTLSKISTVEKLKETAAIYAKKIADQGETAGMWAKVTAYIAAQAAAAPVLAITLALVAALALLTVIVWGVTKAIKAISDAYNKDAIAAEKAKETANELAETYKSVKQEYEDMVNTMSDYENAKKSLVELTKGTIEYEEALTKANEAAQKLIDRYEGLQYEIDSNGLIVINQDSLISAQKEQQQNVIKAQINADRAQLTADQKATKNQRTNFLRDSIKDTSFKEQSGKIIDSAGTTGMMGFVLGGMTANPFLAIAGAIGGIALGALTAVSEISQDLNSATEEEQKAMQQLAEAQKKFGDKSQLSETEYQSYLKRIGISNEELIKSLAANRVEAEKLASEMNANTDAMKALDQRIASNVLRNNEDVQNSRYSNEVVDTASKFISDFREDEINKLEADNWGERGDKDSKEAKDSWKEYIAASGLTGTELVNITGAGDNREFTYKDSEGNEHTIDLETMRNTVADKRISEKISEKGSAIAAIYNNFNKEQMAAVNAAVNGKYDNLNIKQFQSGIAGVTAASLGLSEENLKTMGYDSAEAFNAAMEKAQNNATDDWNKTLRTHTSSVSTAMKEIASSTNDGLQSISYSTLKAYGNMLEGFGEDSDAATSFREALTGIMEANSEDAEKIMLAVTGIDWSQGKIALDQLNGQLYDMGIEIDENSELWKQFQAAVNDMSFSVIHQNLETMRQTLAAIGKLAKDVSFGDVISDEDYKQLTDIDGSLKKDFVMTADGYMYVGEGNLKNKAKDATINQLKKSKSNNEKAVAAYNALQQGSFDGEDWTGLINGTNGDAASISMATQLAANDKITSALGVDAAYIEELVTAMEDTDVIAKDAAREKLKALYSDIQTLESNYNAGLYDNTRAEEVAASQMSAAQLDKAVESEAISSDTAETFKKVLSEAANADKDIFRDVNKELEDVEFNLSKIEKAKENAFGPDKIGLIKQETEQLQKQIKAEKERQALLQEKLFGVKDKEGNKVKEGLQDKLKKDYSFLQFNDDGSISNYDSLYTNLSEDEWEAAKKAIDDYEQSLVEARESELTILDLQNEANSKNLEAYEAADEALSKYTDQLEYHNNVLENYKNLLGLIGKENDYKSIGAILEGQATISEGKLSIAKENATIYDEEVKKWAAAMKAAKDAGDQTALDTYTKNWEEASVKSREAQEQMLSDLQTWAESEKAILENTLADLSKDLEDVFTGGLGFDEVSRQMERAQSAQEEYLTTTNQIYETNKMMRVAQQAIDTTNNTIAKNKFKNFITETKNLQEQGKLSKYELEIQQAKYDLLVAEIALEEAQNAKSVVRLQRDAEGNFGYVYTADEAAVNDAMQKREDAENALYNKGLEGANNYSQKRQTIAQEMTDAINEIQQNYLNGMYKSEEEYQAAMEATIAHYKQQLQDINGLYELAVGIDDNIATEAWGAAFANIGADMETVSSSIETYMTKASNAFSRWGEVVAKIKETTGSDCSAITANVADITTEAERLVTELLGDDTDPSNTGILGKIKEGFSSLASTIADVIAKLSNAKITMSVDTNNNTSDDNAEGAATGGLTSNWGPEGKMLMVHESELILNKEDTRSFFAHLGVMESILSTLDSYALSQQLGGLLTTPAYVEGNEKALEQNVKIEASFPSVTDRNEIEEAFNNLVNKASQYANRR